MSKPSKRCPYCGKIKKAYTCGKRTKMRCMPCVLVSNSIWKRGGTNPITDSRAFYNAGAKLSIV